MHFQKQFIRLHVSCNVFLFRYLAIWYLEFRYQIPDIQFSRYQRYSDLVQVSCYLPTPVPIGKVHDRRSTKSEHFVIIIVIVIILFFSFDVLPDTSPSLHNPGIIV